MPGFHRSMLTEAARTNNHGSHRSLLTNAKYNASKCDRISHLSTNEEFPSAFVICHRSRENPMRLTVFTFNRYSWYLLEFDSFHKEFLMRCCFRQIKLCGWKPGLCHSVKFIEGFVTSCLFPHSQMDSVLQPSVMEKQVRTLCYKMSLYTYIMYRVQ